jgi:hypothetical protein
VEQRRADRDLVGLAEAHKGAREMLAGAIMEWEVAADDFERDASAGADARYLAAIENLRARRQAVAGAKLAVAEARKALRSAEREREAADEDLRAIAEGRRG